MGDRAELRPKIVELRDRDLRPLGGETDPHNTQWNRACPSSLPLAFPGHVAPLGKELAHSKEDNQQGMGACQCPYITEKRQMTHPR